MNFLFDKSFQPYISSREINEYFGTKQTSVGQKSAQIHQILKLRRYWDKDFTTKYISDYNPFNNLMMVNGLIVPEDFFD